MSCNGCRVLRRGCSDHCVLRPCLEWIDTPHARANAILFVSKFFGRSDLISFLSAVPEPKRPALFQSLLFEACGRTVNPVSGAVGLMSSGYWHICQAAVDTVLAGGPLRPISEGIVHPNNHEGGGYDNEINDDDVAWGIRRSSSSRRKETAAVRGRGRESMTMSSVVEWWAPEVSAGKDPKLLNLFV